MKCPDGYVTCVHTRSRDPHSYAPNISVRGVMLKSIMNASTQCEEVVLEKLACMQDNEHYALGRPPLGHNCKGQGLLQEKQQQGKLAGMLSPMAAKHHVEER